MSGINVIPLSQSPSGAPWLEVGTYGALSLLGTPTPACLKFYSGNTNVALPSVVDINGTDTHMLTGIGFGVTNIQAVDSATKQIVASLTIHVGSVVIMGADGNSWRVFPDGACRQVLPSDISQRIMALENKEKIIFAEVGNQAVYDVSKFERSMDPLPRNSATAVTCYLLNLGSLANCDRSKHSHHKGKQGGD